MDACWCCVVASNIILMVIIFIKNFFLIDSLKNLLKCKFGDLKINSKILNGNQIRSIKRFSDHAHIVGDF